MMKFEDEVVNKLFRGLEARKRVSKTLVNEMDLSIWLNMCVYLANQPENVDNICIEGKWQAINKYLIPECLKQIIVPSKITLWDDVMDEDLLIRHDVDDINLISAEEFNNITYKLLGMFKIDAQKVLPYERVAINLNSVITRVKDSYGYVHEYSCIPLNVKFHGKKGVYFTVEAEDALIEYFVNAFVK